MSWYDPKDASGAWPDGEYRATIKSAVNKTSKTSGNPMQEVVFAVYGSHGRTQDVTEWFTGGRALFRYQKLAKAFGDRGAQAFQDGKFDAREIVGANLTVSLITEVQDGDYPDRNRIDEFKNGKFPERGRQPDPEPEPANGGYGHPDDDIPF